MTNLATNSKPKEIKPDTTSWANLKHNNWRYTKSFVMKSNFSSYFLTKIDF